MINLAAGEILLPVRTLLFIGSLVWLPSGIVPTHVA
jgi:hypothetical protein